MVSRRVFIKTLAGIAPILGGAAMCLSSPLWERWFADDHGSLLYALDPLPPLIRSAPRARYWTSVLLSKSDCRQCHHPQEKLSGKQIRHEVGIVKCLLCAQGCIIKEGGRGRCRARMNVGGVLKSLVYGRPMTIHIDPIEKKPFYHFLPGASAFSLATSGCPLRCKFCQNWEISQASPEDYQASPTSPIQIVRSIRAREAAVIAFTYNEPTVFVEYMTDIAREAKKQEVRSVLISCGIMNEAPLAELCETLDAIKIDLKGYDERFYRDVCGAELQPVLRSIKQIAGSDSEKMLRGLIDWILGEIGPDIPVHFTRFHPDYQLRNLPPTPVATLERTREMAMGRGMHYAYVGNVPNHPGNHTYCPSCGKAVIKRTGFFIAEMHMKKGLCAFCRRKISGVWT
jgi:pyruvate formate lyase activating enzyme